METLLIEIPSNKTKKQVIDLLAKNGIDIAGLNPISDSDKGSKKLSKAEQEYEDKVDSNLQKMMDQMTPADLKLVSRATIMKKLGR